MMLTCPLCGGKYEDEKYPRRCDCGGPLQLDVFHGKRREVDEVWARYADFFPYHVSKRVTLGEGDTPLVRAERLSDRYGIDLLLKNETVNPTWSFKDRGTVMGVSRTLEIGFDEIGTVSTGNMAASVAAYGAHIGLDTTVIVPASMEEKKLKQIDVYGADIRKKKGDYGDLYYDSLKMGEEEDIYFINSDDPYRVEGYKSIGFELAEEKDVDHVLIPTSSGGLFRGVVKAYEELYESGFVEKIPRLTAVQASGCSPIYRAFQSGEKVKHWNEPDTVAKAIANPLPPSGDLVVKKLQELNGASTAVGDDAILSAQEDITREGIYCQPASAVGVAALDDLMDDVIREGETVVSIVTGSGMKTA